MDCDSRNAMTKFTNSFPFLSLMLNRFHQKLHNPPSALQTSFRFFYYIQSTRQDVLIMHFQVPQVSLKISPRSFACKSVWCYDLLFVACPFFRSREIDGLLLWLVAPSLFPPVYFHSPPPPPLVIIVVRYSVKLRKRCDTGLEGQGQSKGQG